MQPPGREYCIRSVATVFLDKVDVLILLGVLHTLLHHLSEGGLVIDVEVDAVPVASAAAGNCVFDG